MADVDETAILGAGVVSVPSPVGGFYRVNHDPGEVHAGTVAAAGLQLGAGVVLVHGEGAGWLQLPGAGAELAAHRFVTDALRAGWVVHPDATGWRIRLRSPEQATPWCSVVLLPYDAPGAAAKAGPWGRASFETGVRGLRTFRMAVGRPWRDSVGRTAETIILSTHPRERGGVMLDRSPTVPPPAAAGTLEQPFHWRRPLTEAERAGRWVHAFDANAQYLAAWQVAELGFGEPEHFDRCEFRQKPGLWRPDPAIYEGVGREHLPDPQGRGREWFTTDTVARMVELAGGAVPPMAEAWVWSKGTRYLRGAGELLRDARQSLVQRAPSESVRMAREAVRSLYAVETGRFNMATRDERSGWHRPDWGHIIRARARVNLHRRLAGLRLKKTGEWRDGFAVAPFAIQVDGLYFLTDVDDPVKFAGLAGIPVGSALGQFSHEGSVEVDEVAELHELRNASRVAAWFRERAT